MLKIRMVVTDTSTMTEWEETIGVVPDAHLEQAAAGGATIDALARAALDASPDAQGGLVRTLGGLLREAGAVVAQRLATWSPAPPPKPGNGGIVVPAARPE
jgi:hypothetical protein